MFDVITIGTAAKDTFLISRFFKILKDSKHLKKFDFPTGEAQCFALGGKIELDNQVIATGGGATNAAVTFSRQNLKTAALIKVGKDEIGNYILKELKEEKITPFPIIDKKNGTASSSVLLAPSGERTILVYRGASEKLDIKEIPFNKLKAKWVYIIPGKIPIQVLEKIFNYFWENETSIAFNPSKYIIDEGIDKLKPLLNKTKVVILNKEEASYLTGIDYNKEKEIFKKFDGIVNGITVMTDGAGGVLVSDGHIIYKSGVFKEEKVVDRTGSGDAFGAGFIAGLIQKEEKCEKGLLTGRYGLCQIDNIKYAIRLGSANATSVIEYIGAKKGILTKNEFNSDKRWQKLPIKIIGINNKI
ncbi:MAG: carbohydrate kinase family protein [Patescibacteria group bacterium]